MHSDTITLFNRKESRSGDTWYPTVIRNVHVNMDKSAILAKYGAEAQDSASLYIRYTRDGEKKMVGKKSWLPPKRWGNLLDHTKAITFSDGARFDFFWVGDWGNEDPVEDVDYASDTDFYTYMNKTHDHVFAISSVGGPYSVIPHFEIMGK